MVLIYFYFFNDFGKIIRILKKYLLDGYSVKKMVCEDN